MIPASAYISSNSSLNVHAVAYGRDSLPIEMFEDYLQHSPEYALGIAIKPELTSAMRYSMVSALIKAFGVESKTEFKLESIIACLSNVSKNLGCDGIGRALANTFYMLNTFKYNIDQSSRNRIKSYIGALAKIPEGYQLSFCENINDFLLNQHISPTSYQHVLDVCKSMWGDEIQTLHTFPLLLSNRNCPKHLIELAVSSSNLLHVDPIQLSSKEFLDSTEKSQMLKVASYISKNPEINPELAMKIYDIHCQHRGKGESYHIYRNQYKFNAILKNPVLFEVLNGNNHLHPASALKDVLGGIRKESDLMSVYQDFNATGRALFASRFLKFVPTITQSNIASPLADAINQDSYFNILVDVATHDPQLLDAEFLRFQDVERLVERTETMSSEQVNAVLSIVTQALCLKSNQCLSLEEGFKYLCSTGKLPLTQENPFLCLQDTDKKTDPLTYILNSVSKGGSDSLKENLLSQILQGKAESLITNDLTPARKNML